MSTRTDTKQVNVTNFKPWAAPRRRAGLRDDQMAVSTHSITLPVNIAAKLGEKVAILWSEVDKAIAIQKSADGDYKFRTVGKNKSSKSLYCKTLLEAKKVKKGRYSTQFDEKSQMLVSRLG